MDFLGRCKALKSLGKSAFSSIKRRKSRRTNEFESDAVLPPKSRSFLEKGENWERTKTAVYEHILAKYTDGNVAIPIAYSYTSEEEGLQYEFTLGNKVFVYPISGGEEEVYFINNADPNPTGTKNLPEYKFHEDMTNEQFRNFILMTRINEYLTAFYSDDVNVVAINQGSGLQFNLGLSDYAAEDSSVITKLSSVIDGPGFFAVVDQNSAELDQVVRILSFGGAELILKKI